MTIKLPIFKMVAFRKMTVASEAGPVEMDWTFSVGIAIPTFRGAGPLWFVFMSEQCTGERPSWDFMRGHEAESA
jgi:hypothetical protein